MTVGGNVQGMFCDCGYYNKLTSPLGIKGRMCPYLFNKMTSVSTLDFFYRNCRHIWGYMQKDEDGNFLPRLIPADMIPSTAKNLRGMFSGMTIPFRNVFKGVFNKLKSVTSITMPNIFAACNWSIDGSGLLHKYTGIFDDITAGSLYEYSGVFATSWLPILRTSSGSVIANAGTGVCSCTTDGATFIRAASEGIVKFQDNFNIVKVVNSNTEYGVYNGWGLIKDNDPLWYK